MPAAERLEADTVIDRLDLAAAMRLPTQSQCDVVALRYFGGLSTAEIAVVMRREPSTIYSLHARALIAMRGNLAPDPAGTTNSPSSGNN